MSDRRAVPRYALAMPISIRTSDLVSVDRYVGKTLEISTRGVHFTVESALSPGTSLDFTIKLQPEYARGTEVFIHGSGRVSRVVESDENQYQVAMAVERFQISRDQISQDSGLPDAKSKKMDAAWTLSGTYFETCNCEVACPCVFLGPPTTGECTALIGWHIERGNFDGIPLDGLNVAIAVHSPGDMTKAKWKAAIYLDDRATQAQNDALEGIFSGRAGGHLKILSAHIGEMLGVRSVPIEYHADGNHRRLRIPDIAESEIEGIPGQNSNPVTIANHPFCVAPGFPAAVAKSKRLLFSDYGSKWNITEKNAFFSRFQYSNR